MDENPCTQVAQDSDANLASLYAALALTFVNGDSEVAESWLRRMPRSERGRVRIALEDLSMMIERLGN